MESKQIEHVINERLILEEAAQHPFCVSLVGAYQDKTSLHLLQVRQAGGAAQGAQRHGRGQACPRCHTVRLSCQQHPLGTCTPLLTHTRVDLLHHQ